MKFDLMVPETIAADWDRLAAILEPAVRVDEAMTLRDVKDSLLSGEMAAYDVDLQGIEGVIVVEIDAPSLWVRYASGRISGPKTEWVGRVKALQVYFEGVARDMNCTELRVRGRDWSPILPNWEKVGPRNELRLVL